MAFHLLQHDRDGARRIAASLQSAVVDGAPLRALPHLHRSRRCAASASTRRATARQLCVVETPADQAALERTGSYRGLYFVLMGRLSPLDGVGPLRHRRSRSCSIAPATATVEEVIIATNFTAEGEATAHVLGEALQVARLPRHAARARRAGRQRARVRRPRHHRARPRRSALSARLARWRPVLGDVCVALRAHGAVSCAVGGLAAASPWAGAVPTTRVLCSVARASLRRRGALAAFAAT